MKRIFPALVLVLAAAAGIVSHAQTGLSAGDVMKRVRERESVTTLQTRVRMQLVDKGGSTSERLIDQFSVTEKGVTKTAIIFQAPASVKDTRFLSIRGASGTEDRWIFLPALGKVRRLAASEGGASFMGTDFSYDDLSAVSSRPADADEYRLVSAETVAGRTVYVVEVKPKDSAGSAYSRSVQTVPSDTWIASRIELYDREGTLVKVNEILETRSVDGRTVPAKSVMRNVRTGHSTTLLVEKIIFDKPIPAGVFTVKFLETGRP